MKKMVLFSFLLTAGVAQLFGAAQHKTENGDPVKLRATLEAQAEQLAALEKQVAEEAAAFKSCSTPESCKAALESFKATLIEQSTLAEQRGRNLADFTRRYLHSPRHGAGIMPPPRRNINKARYEGPIHTHSEGHTSEGASGPIIE